MLSINTNTSSLIAQNSMKSSTNKLNQAIERMTTGAKINHAKDNAANYSIATNMTTKINAYQVAEDNINQGLNMVGTALETLFSLSDYTNRLRSLAIQAQNNTYGDKSIDALNSEAVSIINEIYRTKNSAEYNGISLFGGVEQVSDITFPDGTTQKIYEFINNVTRRDTSSLASIESLDETKPISGGAYSVSTVEGLEKAFSMINTGNLTSAELVLAKNIDYSEFTGIHTQVKVNFDGNGYVISNFTSTTSNSFLGEYSEIKNLGLQDVYISTNRDGACAFANKSNIQNCYATGYIKGKNCVAGITGLTKGKTIKNCYFIGEVQGAEHSIGGILGFVDFNNPNTIENCYSAGIIQGGKYVGGIIGSCSDRIDCPFTLKNCCSTADIISTSKDAGSAGGLTAGVNLVNQKSVIENCYSTGKVSCATANCGGLVGEFSSVVELTNCYYNIESSGQSDTGKGIGVTSAQLNRMVALGQLPDYDLDLPISDVNNSSSNKLYAPAFIEFQVGVSAEDSAGIYINLTFTIDGLKDLCYKGLSSKQSLIAIDKMVKSISDKEIELGVLQNRLESALDEISTQYNNLVSSRSTIQDADIAEVSSEYIKMQILQQASATLMATANQSPSVALQLL